MVSSLLVLSARRRVIPRVVMSWWQSVLKEWELKEWELRESELKEWELCWKVKLKS